MTDVSGIPNMGFGGGGYFGGNAATGQPAMSAAQINASMGWNPNAAQYNPFANSGGYFGAQPAAYAAAGAAYGRQVAPSSPAAVAAYHGGSAQADRLRSLYPNAFSGGGIGSDAARVPVAVPPPPPTVPQSQDWEGTFNDTVSGNSYNPYPLGDSSYYPNSYSYQGGGIGSDARYGGQSDRLRALYPGAFSGGGYYGGGLAYGQPSANPSYFNPATYAGSQGNYGIPYNGRPMAGDIGFSAQPSYPNLGYNPGMQNWFANPSMGGGAFQGRFGMGFPNAGTPSQVYPGYGDSLTPMDRLGIPHLGFGGSAETGGGGA